MYKRTVAVQVVECTASYNEHDNVVATSTTDCYDNHGTVYHSLFTRYSSNMHCTPTLSGLHLLPQVLVKSQQSVVSLMSSLKLFLFVLEFLLHFTAFCILLEVTQPFAVASGVHGDPL